MLPPLCDPYLQPFAGRDVWSLLSGRAKARPNHPFLVWEPLEGEPQRWTYERFAHDVERLASGLAMCGLARGDRLLVHLDNCPEFLLTWFACARLGVIAVTTNPRSAVGEIRYFAAHAGVRAAITQPDLAAAVAEAAPSLDWLAVTGEPYAGTLIGSPFSGLYADYPPPPHAPDALAPLCVQYTSGTTARPKGVVLTHANALWAARTNAAHEGLRADDIHLVVLPLCHINALGYSMLASLWAGATVVLQPRFSASRFWEVSNRNRCTWASLIPFCIRALADQPRPDHNYRLLGYPVCDPPSDRFMGVRSIGWWGMTETISHGIVGDAHQPGLPMSMGTPAPEYDLKVTGPDGAAIKPGETGDLFIRGARGLSLFSHYLNDMDATAAAFDDEGYFITGDRVTLTDTGHLVFADRAKDMLKVGGENVAASEIERTIRTVAGVLDVAVVGRPDPLRDEAPVAFVIATPSADLDQLRNAISATCARELAKFKQPAEIRFTEAFPRATLDKVAKAELRKLLVAPVG
jgi:crotonobetaine/carnitine-CoA ligase